MKKKSSISASELIEFLKRELNELPDKRKGKNKKYQIKEAFLAAFSVFFTQCPSFLEHQSLMKQKKGKDNAESLFGLKEIPCDNQIRTLLDPIPAKTIFKTFKTNVPLRESEPTLMVNWYEVELVDVRKNEVIYKNSFITNHELKKKKMLLIITAGRTRWKIENENNNTLKNQGYNLEHNFGHGQENLSETLLSLNLLSFLYHNILELVNVDYQKIREKLVKRTRFFNDLRALLRYIWFISWEDLWIFMFTDGEERKLINSS